MIPGTCDPDSPAEEPASGAPLTTPEAPGPQPEAHGPQPEAPATPPEAPATPPEALPPPGAPALSPPAPPRIHPLVVALAAAVLVTAVSWLAPSKYSATLVGLAFLGVTWWMVLRHDETTIRRHGLALGGLLEPLRIDPRRLFTDLGKAVALAAGFCVVVFPAYAVGFWLWWAPKHAWRWRPPPSIFDELTGQILVIALPEEAFYRGYLQTALDEVWPPRWKIFGAMLGPSWLVTAFIFAVGHVLTNPNPGRMAVFFPALIFGWMRARTGGIGTGVAFHAACNLFSATLFRGYGMTTP